MKFIYTVQQQAPEDKLLAEGATSAYREHIAHAKLLSNQTDMAVTVGSQGAERMKERGKHPLHKLKTFCS